MAINLYAPVELSMAVAPLLPSGGGIINITSTDSEDGSYNSLAYAASKAALESATRSLANVFGPRGVRVNAISPGWIATDMADLAGEIAAGLTPLGRLGTPAEVASCVAWLLGEGSSFVSGASITLDGGLSNVDYVLFKEAQADER
jgi:NAD(P)-dependent dehydrogenase (short-subunit alcohol dehydrogenase family)